MLCGRLALEFGIPLFELLERLSPCELAYWQAFERVEGPIGYRRFDILAAFFAYMSERVKIDSKPEQVAALYQHFLRDLSAWPIDRVTDEELEQLEEKKDLELERLTNKIFAIFGPPPPELLNDDDRET